jgi:hypothetical protein
MFYKEIINSLINVPKKLLGPTAKKLIYSATPDIKKKAMKLYK